MKRFLVEGIGIFVAFFISIVLRDKLGVSIVGTSWNINFLVASVTLDPLASVYSVFVVIYETGYWCGRLVQKMD